MKLIKAILNTSISQATLDWVLLGYRIAISLSILSIHGAKKIIHFEEEIIHIPDPFHMGGYVATIIAIFANVVCAIFIAMGLFTRFFALGALSIPLIGLLVVHINDPWAIKDVPLMYSIAFLIILILGPGRHSLDRIVSKKWFNKEYYK
ncbi:DoxX family protein [uncultured Aquimarina sp.]|uniref:DoxX family protein n=1 Tax=uncultured Aquimarina sp. TaxID=575652 RepID=UPI002604ACAF|nr:DoxX family protein [uncultured Aquimarina sp.]